MDMFSKREAGVRTSVLVHRSLLTSIAQLNISELSKTVQDRESFNDLVLPEGFRDMILNLVVTHLSGDLRNASEGPQENVIQAKGTKSWLNRLKICSKIA